MTDTPDKSVEQHSATVASGETNQATAFIEQVEQKFTLPELEFYPSSQLFVMIPACRESATAERLFDAWSSQELPSNTHIEVVICVNQRDDNTETFEDNQQTVTKLQSLSQQNESNQVRFHIIDKSTPDKRFNPQTNIGDIRNFIAASAIKASLPSPRNAILLSTDADTFPIVTCAQTLLTKVEGSSMYGGVDKKLEFATDFDSVEARKIKQLFLLTDVHEIILDYLSSGRLELAESMGAGGAGFFTTIDRFVGVGGYASLGFGEDTELINKLLDADPSGFNPVETAELINLVRPSNRLQGDGHLLAELREQDYATKTPLETALAHAEARAWFIANAGVTYLEACKALHDYATGLQATEINLLLQTLDDVNSSVTHQQKTELLYGAILTKIYQSDAVPLAAAFKEYANYIKANFSTTTGLQQIIEVNQSAFGDATDEAIVFSFVELVSKNETINP